MACQISLSIFVITLFALDEHPPLHRGLWYLVPFAMLREFTPSLSSSTLGLWVLRQVGCFSTVLFVPFLLSL